MFVLGLSWLESDLIDSCARHEDISSVEVHCLSFVDGEPHPSAENPDLVVNFPGPTSSQQMQVQITGDHILLSCNGSPNDENQVDVLFLVSWKEGKIASVSILSILRIYWQPVAS